MKEELIYMIPQNEKVLFEGRGDKKTFILESIINPLLPIAIVWLAFDSTFIAFAFGAGGMKVFLLPFMLLHLMPVWIYLGNMIFMGIRYRNTYYAVTDRSIYTCSGVFQKHYVTKSFAEMSHIDIHRGMFDQITGVGDVVITTNQVNAEGRHDTLSLDNLKNYVEVFGLIKKLQQDIYSDIMYPNDLRPKENHGYNTEYRG